MSLLAGLVLRDAGRPARSRGLDALLAAEPAGDARLRADRPGMILAGAGEGARLEESPSGWLLADLDVPGAGDLATPGALQALWAREGSAVLSRLRGGFAVALVDPARRHALLAADRFGFRRLYYAATAEGLAWGTRAEAALAAGGVSRAVDPEAVYAYLNYGTVPAPQTIYRGVRRLPPGHCLVWRDGTVSIERYWDVAYREEPVSREVAAAALMRHTETAVGAALTGLEAKETGAFLSGGTDSSTVVGLITRLTGERANAFSIGFAEERYNELGYAEIAARHFNAAHYTKRVSADEAYACVADLVSAYDEPFGNASAIPTLLCARFARQTGMRTLLAGDGGDEIFGGNERYRREQVLARYDRLPAALRRGVIEPILRRVPAERRDLLGKAQRYVERASAGNPARFYASEFFVAREREQLLHPDFLAAITADGPLRVAERHYRAARAGAELNRLLYIDVKITLGDNDLFKVTRTAEAAGMAVRFPLLDHPLVEFMATLPAWHKVRGTEKRHLFKRAMRGFLPAEILAKPKHGFGLPISDWLRDHAGFRELLRDTVASRAARERGYWAPGALESLCDRFARDTTAFYGGVLWTVLMLELWHARHGDRE